VNVTDERTMSDRSWPMARTERQGDGARAGVGTITRQGRRPVADQPAEAAEAAQNPRRARPPRPGRAQPQPAQAKQAPPAQPVQPPAQPRPQRQAPARQAPAQQAPVQQAQVRWGQPRRPQPRQAQAQQTPVQQAPVKPRQRPGRAPWRVPPAERVTVPQPALRVSGPQAALRVTGPQRALRVTGPPPVLPQAPAPGQPAPAPAQPQSAQPQPARAYSAAEAQRRMPFVLLLCGLLGGALVCALVISTTLAEGSFQITKLQDSTNALTRQRQVLEEQVARAQSAQVIAQRASELGLRRPGELLFLDLKTGKTSNDGPTWPGAVNAPGYAP
jgi:hypothetical protein